MLELRKAKLTLSVLQHLCLLAVGVASGICLYFGLISRKNSKLEETKREIDDGRCACCLAPFLVSRGVRCNDCGAKSCKKACSRWDTSDNAWHCIFCYQQRLWVRRNEKWFDIFGNAANEEEEVHSVFGTAKSRVYVAGHAVAVPNMEQIQEDREEKYMVHAVQNFVEKIVEGLIDSVDDTPIDRLYNDAKYDKFLEEHRPPLIAALTRLIACLEASLINKPSTDPPAMAHGALREIVERAVEEARKLPGLSADTENPREGRAIADNSYEDLLATAILNKVIEKYQRERVDGNSNVLRDTDSPKAKCTRIETENGLEEEDVASYACYRPESNGDRSESIGRNGDDQEPVSFMMEERIEEITTITDDGELQNNDALEFKHTRRVPFPEYGMDIVDPRRELSSPTLSTSSDSSDLNRDEFSPVRTKRHAADHATDLVSPIESWEDNWLFQKKKTSRSQPDAVAMLVPSSNADYKALIGDRDAEDTSDLSECSSTKSDEEIEKELIEAINNVVPRTPRTSECDAKSNQMLNSQKMLSDTECRRNEVDACQKETKVEETVVICKRFNKDEKNAKVNENLLEEKTIKDEDDKETQNESSSTLITVAEKNIEAIKSNEEKPKNTIESDEKTIVNIAVESFAQTSMKMQSEKPNERNDREGNIAEEEQQESEYTEHYDTAIQRHLDSLTKVEVCSAESEMADETRKITDEQLRKSENNSTEKQKSERSEAEVQLSYATIEEDYVDATTNNDRLSAPPRPGTIAEREHKKWENALPIENNPYSEESIRKRCLERQYSRTSDISGAHYELTKLNEVNLETLLVPNRPDIKRFGRDYYINQSKAANGEQHERARSAMSSVSSRPSSSLSQQSNSDEQREQQEESTSKEADDISIPQEDKDTRTASWRKNNAEVISPETNNRTVNSRASAVDVGSEKAKSEDDEMKWKDHQRADDILENQRKNSKNEINAKLNNQENNHEAERKDDKDRKVRKIDLKAYGFENEFSEHKTTATRQQRMVNRLDLSSYGYHDGILRRAHSNYQLNEPIMRNNEKSNLTRCRIVRRSYSAYDASESFDCKDFAKSTKDLNKLQDNVEQVNSRLISAKSMPNVADDMYYKANPVYVNQDQDDLAAKNLLDHVIDKSEEETTTDERDAITRDDNSLLNDYDEISSDMDRSFENIYVENKDQVRQGVDEELRVMPSVKRLAQAFGRRQTSEIETAVPAKVTRVSVAKIEDAKDRSSTPEIQIIETPRQMHSLTARSLCREFREGLRQIPNKMTSPPVSRSLIEELPANRTEVVRSIREDNDTDVISSDKFKSNIIFWEQLQKKN
ncbi:uncharacterized protein [Linepithema humile]|uniref:uncharacterized protein isoform X3 n=1 Tax=Linepithema humile TaxID=83485 RepID=UPI0006232360|nr:PREDICTED: uncharacterized protein LOC105671981 isoform X2 [Linepithema humile]